VSDPNDVERRDAPAPVLPVVDYSTPPPQNRAASRALMFGLLGFIPFVPGILAIRAGRRGLRDAAADPKIGGQGPARVGVILGIVSITVWVAVCALAVPATMRARQQAIRVQCMSQLRQIGMATMMYASANSGFLPPTMDELVKSRLIPAMLFTCPACAGNATKPVASTGAYGNYNYIYLGAGRRLQTLRPASSTPLVYELPTNHTDPGINVLYADGHVELIKGPQVQALLAQVAAPPPPPTATDSPPSPLEQ
jgi:prepilin-type processing-associated H-X9-DG protein